MATLKDVTNAILRLELKDVPELQPYFTKDGKLKESQNIVRSHKNITS